MFEDLRWILENVIGSFADHVKVTKARLGSEIKWSIRVSPHFLFIYIVLAIAFKMTIVYAALFAQP